MKINTIYPAIEGEGVRVGTPQLFIRTQGCSIGCKNCDTVGSWNPNTGTEMSVKEIFQKVIDSGLDSISITGGNPLEQDLYDLVGLLHRRNFTVNIEITGQDNDEEVLDLVDFISCDIKTPSTGVTANLDIIDDILKSYGHCTQIKCVCADQADLDFIIDCYNRFKDRLDYHMVITPCWTERASAADVEFIDHIMKTVMDNNYHMRVIVQQHKLLFGSKRGDV